MMSIKYIKFLWKSTNAHGVHSPFVFNLVTQCFYAKQSFGETAFPGLISTELTFEQTNLLYRLMHYFRPQTIAFSGYDISQMSSIITHISNHLKIPIGIKSDILIQEVDMVLLNAENKAFKSNIFDMLSGSIHNNTVVILNNIHSNKETATVWNAIKSNSKVTVSIDTYYLGIVFFRREQEKEHFIIRISNSLLINAVLGTRKLWGLLS